MRKPVEDDLQLAAQFAMKIPSRRGGDASGSVRTDTREHTVRERRERRRWC